MNQVITISYKDVVPQGYEKIDVTSRGTTIWKELSPFVNRPQETYTGDFAQNIENLWQFSKVYPQHVLFDKILPEYYCWRDKGWSDKYAHRYPMCKGQAPLFSLWDSKKLNYIEARKQIYFPEYQKNVVNTEIFNKLKTKYQNGDLLAIRDFDVYRFDLLNMTLKDVVNNPNKKAGHGFVIYKMLSENI